MAANMFREKMALLNENFLQFIQQALSSKPSADLTPTMKDYMKHVEELDRLYGGVESSPSTSVSSRTVLKEAPKPTYEPPKRDLLAPAPAPSIAQKPVISFPTFGFEKKTAEKEVEPQKTTDLNGSGSRSTSRKRRQEGLSMEDYYKAKESLKVPESSTTSTPVTSFKEAAAAFKQAQETDKPLSTTSSAAPSPNISLFTKTLAPPATFPSFTTSTPITQGDDKGSKPAQPAIPTFRFGQAPSSTTETPSVKPSIPLFTFGQKLAEEKKEDAEKPKTIPAFPTFGMPASTSQKDKENGDKNTVPVSDLTEKDLRDELAQYGYSQTGPITPSTRRVYEKKLENFRKTSTKIGQKPDEEGDNEPQEVPPVVEVVEHNEPDAIYSAKCVLFSFVSGEYKKIGVGFLHVKKLDDKLQMLLRAANTLGTIWVNTMVNDQLKAEKVKDTQLRISYPTETGVKTNLIRFGKAEEVTKILDYVNKKSA